jgi:hypothetical protein
MLDIYTLKEQPLVTVTVTAMESLPASTDPSDSEGESSSLTLTEGYTPLPVYKDAGMAVTDFGGLLPANKPLRLREDLKEGCGGQLWPAGMVLASYMLRYRAEGLRGKRM